MIDLVERLRREGENAMRKHLSLGMWQLCQEAADEIERLLGAMQRTVAENRHLADGENCTLRHLTAALAAPITQSPGMEQP